MSGRRHRRCECGAGPFAWEVSREGKKHLPEEGMEEGRETVCRWHSVQTEQSEPAGQSKAHVRVRPLLVKVVSRAEEGEKAF